MLTLVCGLVNFLVQFDKSIVRSLKLLEHNKLARRSEDGSIQIWKIDSGECIRTIT